MARLILLMPAAPVLPLVLIRYIASFLLVPVVVMAGGVVFAVAVVIGVAVFAGLRATHDEYGFVVVGLWLSGSLPGFRGRGEDCFGIYFLDAMAWYSVRGSKMMKCTE